MTENLNADTASKIAQHDKISSACVFHSQMEAAFGVIERAERLSRGAHEPICVLVTGPSGSGKSSIIKLHQLEKPADRSGAVYRVPVLAVTVPPRPTPKALAESMLRELGDPAAHRGTETSLTARVVLYLRACGVTSVMLDEFHHFAERGTQGSMRFAADWLKTVIDRSGVPFILFGLDQSTDVFATNEQLARRFSKRVRLRPFDWEQEDERTDYVGFLFALIDEMGMQNPPAPDKNHFAYRMYLASSGMVGHLSLIIREAARTAVDAGKTTVTVHDLHTAFLGQSFLWEQLKFDPFDKKFDIDAAYRNRTHAKVREQVATIPMQQYKEDAARRAMGRGRKR